MVTLEQNLAGVGANVEGFKLMLTKWIAIPNAMVGIFIPLLGLMILTRFFGKDKSIKHALAAAPCALFAGLAFVIPYVLIAATLGPDLPSLLGGFIGLGIVIFAAKRGFLVPKKKWDFPAKSEWESSWMSNETIQEPSQTKMSLLKAWLPYAMIAIILVVTRIPSLGLKSLLASQTLSLSNVLGIDGLNYVLKWAYLPGTIPFILVALITNVIYRMKTKEVVDSWKTTFKQINGAGLESMLTVMANSIADLAGAAYPVISPIVGVLGSFMSGSATVSNLLFASLQFETASILQIPEVLIVAAQTSGAALGNMICINNVVAVCATVGCVGAEGSIIRRNAIPAFIYYLLIMLIIVVLISLGVDPMPL